MIQPLLIPTAAEKRIDTDFYVEGYATTFDKPYLLYEWDGNKLLFDVNDSLSCH